MFRRQNVHATKCPFTGYEQYYDTHFSRSFESTNGATIGLLTDILISSPHLIFFYFRESPVRHSPSRIPPNPPLRPSSNPSLLISKQQGYVEELKNLPSTGD